MLLFPAHNFNSMIALYSKTWYNYWNARPQHTLSDADTGQADDVACP